MLGFSPLKKEGSDAYETVEINFRQDNNHTIPFIYFKNSICYV